MEPTCTVQEVGILRGYDRCRGLKVPGGTVHIFSCSDTFAVGCTIATIRLRFVADRRTDDINTACSSTIG